MPASDIPARALFDDGGLSQSKPSTRNIRMMSNRSYLLRLIIPFAIMIVAVVALSGWLIYHSGQDSARKRQIQQLVTDAALLARTIREDGSRIHDTVIERADAEAKFRNVRLSIVDRDGDVIFDSHVPLHEMDNHNDRPEIMAARATGTGQSVRQSRSQGVDYIYAAELVDETSGLVIRTSRPEQAPLVVSNAMLLQLCAAVVMSILIMTWLAVTLQRRWFSPVRQLAIAAEQMAAGQWDTRVEPSGVSELQEFSLRMNFLAEQAQNQLSDLQQQRADLESLVDSLPDPIVLTDPQQRIVLLNEPAARFLSVTPKQVVGAKLISVLGETSLVDLYEHLIGQSGRSVSPLMRDFRVLRMGQKFTYQAVAARTPAGGMLLVLRDITKLASTVQMKTDFVANASHELRTPIAAIKLAFETLGEVYQEDLQQTSRCINIIAGHLQRLEDLLQDLLDLSRVENADIKPEIVPLHAKSLLENVQSTHGPIAQSKGLQLQLDYDPSLDFQSDRRLLDLVLKNLVENAIKYTPAGGRVTVKLQQEDKTIVLRVEDTGIGIPPQHLERVFERFYQVDSARSSSVGRGTGLGLAIVKHAVNALGGQVKLHSTVGRGTTATCTFPVLTAVGSVGSVWGFSQ